MDPITAAGIGLGITSLLGQTFSGCIKGYELLMDIIDMPIKYQHLRTRLRIEQSRLLNWGQKVGLLEEFFEQPSKALQLNHNIILDVLIELQTTFRSCVKVTSKYDAQVPETSFRIIDGPSSTESFLRRTLRHWERPSRIAARIHWAMIKQDTFENAIIRLVSFNDRMESFLDRSTVNELHVMQEKSNLLLLQISEQVDQLTELAQALSVDQKDTTNRSTLSRSSTLVEDLTTFKIEDLNLEDKTDGPLPPLNAKDFQLKPVMYEGDRSIIKVPQKMVWVEWKSPAEDFPSEQVDSIINKRLAKLAALLSSPKKPSAFRSPNCMGYLRHKTDDDIRYGLVYEIPIAENGEPRTITSLREVIGSAPMPSLTQRIALTLALVESLMYLHAVNWLHKDFRSDNIVFYVPAGDNRKDFTLASPVIAGFDFSRPDLPDETTIKSLSHAHQDYYKHPDLLQQSNVRSQKSHDIYSLGVVMVEIALWITVEDVMKLALGKALSRSQIPKIRQTLLDGPFEEHINVLSAVESRTGETYAEVTRRCLENGPAIGIRDKINQGTPAVGVQIQQVFHDEIWGKLQAIKL